MLLCEHEGILFSTSMNRELTNRSVWQKRWEFYAQLVLLQFSQALVNVSFRVLFSELIPKGSEVEWFGLQLILSCATVRGYLSRRPAPQVLSCL